MKNTLCRLIQIFSLLGGMLLFIPVLIVAIPFVIFLLLVVQPLNYANATLKRNVRIVSGGNGGISGTLH